MSKEISILVTGGSTPAPAPQFGEVPPGTSSAVLTSDLKNTGTEALSTVRAWVNDTRYRVTINGTLITATTEGDAQDVGPLAVGAIVPLAEQWVTPADAPDSALLVTAQLNIKTG